MKGRSLPFGQVAVASFVVCTLTGVPLAFFYEPSVAPVTYDGPYGPLAGTEVSRAFASTMRISFELTGGLLLRQLHHWSASIMIAALLLHILRVFFTGRFRRPRRLAWLALFGILFASLGAGLTGHFLPDDMLSGNSLAVLDGLLKGVPVVGTWLSDLVFQGRYPSGAIATSYPLHVYVLPVVIAALFLVARPPRPARLAAPLRRAAAVRGGAMFFAVFGVLTLLATTVTVNPIWRYGPSHPGNASAGDGALWYLAFIDGAQRLVPPGWEFEWLGRTWAIAILAPVAVSGLYLVTAMFYPFIEAWVTGDTSEHDRPTRPREAPTRTGIGVAGVVFYGVLWAAAGSDSIALQFDLAFEGIVRTLQVGLVLGPVIAYVVTKRICLGLRLKDRDEARHGYETGRIVQLPSGEYVEVRKKAS